MQDFTPVDYGSCCASLFNSSDDGGLSSTQQDGDGSYDDSYYLVYEYEEPDDQPWYKNNQDYKQEELPYAGWLGEYFGCDWGGNHLCSEEGDGSFESLHTDFSGDQWPTYGCDGWGYESNQEEEGVDNDRWDELYDAIFGY